MGKTGRPATVADSVRFTVSVSADVKAQLDAFAGQRGVSVAELVREAIDAALHPLIVRIANDDGRLEPVVTAAPRKAERRLTEQARQVVHHTTKAVPHTPGYRSITEEEWRTIAESNGYGTEADDAIERAPDVDGEWTV